MEQTSNQVSTVAPTALNPSPGNGHLPPHLEKLSSTSQQVGQHDSPSLDEEGFKMLATAFRKVRQFDRDIAALNDSIKSLKKQLQQRSLELIAGEAERATARQELNFLHYQLQQEMNQELDFPSQV